jgi:hypothetical protein
VDTTAGDWQRSPIISKGVVKWNKKVFTHTHTHKRGHAIRGCNQKFPDWPPRARTANDTALCHSARLYHYFVSQSSESCRHNLLCCFSVSVCRCLFRYRPCPETFGYTFVYPSQWRCPRITMNCVHHRVSNLWYTRRSLKSWHVSEDGVQEETSFVYSQYLCRFYKSRHKLNHKNKYNINYKKKLLYHEHTIGIIG